jgi:hypothetical protein
MTALFHRLFLIILLLILLPGTVPAKTSPEHSARLKAMRDEVEILKGMQPKDTEFRSNMGLAIPQKQAELLGKKGKTEIQDLDLSEKTNKVRTETVEKRLGKRNQQMDARKKTIGKIQEKNRKYKALEQSLAKNEKKARERIREITDQKAQNKGKLSRKLKSELKVQRKKLVNAKVSGQKVKQNRAKIKRSRNAAQYKRLKASIAKDRKLLTKLKTSKSRGKLWKNKGGFVVGALLSALSADLEENALAKKEGRPISKTKKAYNFFKNVSGISAAEGAYTNISIAQMEAYVKTLEVYEGLGYDITDPYVQERAANAVRRAVLRTTVYEGAKLAPVISDMISVKEGFDAAGDAYVASEDTAWTEANNTQIRFQTSLRAAMKAEARLAELRKTAEQAKILTASLGKLKKQLLEMEKEALADRKQVSQAIRILEAYNEQAVALQNRNAADVLVENNVAAMIERLKAIKRTADEQADNVERVKSEHQSGELTAQGVATQAGFIANLLEQPIQDYAALSQSLAGIEALSRGSELSAQIPRALETIRQARGMLAQQSRLSGKLFALYKDQAGALDEAVRQHQAARKEMNKFLDYVSESQNLEDAHQIRIRDALDQANNIGIDQTAVRQALNDARGLRNSAEMVTALAGLDKAPQVVNQANLEELTRQAQQAWGQLSGPNQQAAESIQRAAGLLEQLAALAGDAEPVAFANTPPEPKADIVQRGLFAGHDLFDLQPIEFKRILVNKTEKHGYARERFLGFVASPKPPSNSSTPCRKKTDGYCPGEETLYRILEQGTTRRAEYEKTDDVPFWIVLKPEYLAADLYIKELNVAPLDAYDPLISMKNRKNVSVDVSRVSVRSADEALSALVTDNRNGTDELYLFARRGPLYLRVKADMECAAARIESLEDDYRYELNQRELQSPRDDLLKKFGRNFFESCEDGYEKREEVLAGFLGDLMSEATPYLEKIRRRFYFKPIDMDVEMEGMQESYNYGQRVVKLNPSYIGGPEFTSEKKISHGGVWEFHREGYDSSIVMQAGVSYKTSPKQFLKKIDEGFDEEIRRYLNQKNTAEIPVTIEGADYARLVRNYWVKKRQGSGMSSDHHNYSETLCLRIANIRIIVHGVASYPEERAPRTVELASKIAAKILSSPRGW